MAEMAAAETLPLLADPSHLLGLVAGDAPGDQAKRERAVRSASADFRAAVRHPVSRVTGARFTLDGPGGTTLRLPVLNPTITAVRINGQDVTDTVRASHTGYLERPAGWPRGFGTIEVELDHGLETLPEDITAAVLERAAWAANVMPGINMLVLDGATVQFRPETGTSQKWTDAVEKYRIGLGDRA